MPNFLARAPSIPGHPLLLLPAAALLLAAHEGAGTGRLAVLALALATVAATVTAYAYSWWQVRRGRWKHVDAIGHGERRAPNRVLLLAFAVAWSRMALSRHPTRDLVAGALAGTPGGLLFRQRSSPEVAG